jgi:hypothetical protein
MKKVNTKNKEGTLEPKNERKTLHLSNNSREKKRNTKRLMIVKHMNFY